MFLSQVLKFRTVPKKANPLGYFKITLIRSAIGLPPKTRNAVKSLGLNKINQTVFKVRSDVSVGHIFKVKELVKVENVEKIEWADRTAAKGFEVVSSRFDKQAL